MIPLSIHTEEWKLIVVTIGDYFVLQMDIQHIKHGFLVKGNIYVCESINYECRKNSQSAIKK